MIRQMVLDWAQRTMARRPPDFLIGPQGDPYMKRWYITPWSNYDRSNPPRWSRWTRWLPSIYLHHIIHDDEDRALHDHPWASCSWLLQNNYWEVLFDNPDFFVTDPTRKVFRAEGSVNFRKATTAHRLVLDKTPLRLGRVESTPVVSLFFTGPVIRGWGFHCPKGWVHWREFVAIDNRGSVGKGCE